MSAQYNVVELLEGVKNPMLHIDGFIYYKSQERNGRINWKCRAYPECRARAVTKSGAPVQAEEQISNIVLTYQSKKDEGRIADYLRAIGYNVQF